MATIMGFDENAKSRVTCKSNSYKPGCGAIITYNQNDIKTYSGHDYSGGPDGREWINCPNCGREITLRAW